jgi:hypothetical protein
LIQRRVRNANALARIKHLRLFLSGEASTFQQQNVMSGLRKLQRNCDSGGTSPYDAHVSDQTIPLDIA